MRSRSVRRPQVCDNCHAWSRRKVRVPEPTYEFSGRNSIGVVRLICGAMSAEIKVRKLTSLLLIHYSILKSSIFHQITTRVVNTLVGPPAGPITKMILYFHFVHSCACVLSKLFSKIQYKIAIWFWSWRESLKCAFSNIWNREYIENCLTGQKSVPREAVSSRQKSFLRRALWYFFSWCHW